MQRIRFTGFDSFQLTLEEKDTIEGTSGNTCHYVLELEGALSAQTLSKHLRKNALYTQLAQLKLRTPLFRTPYWEVDPTETNETIFTVNTYQSDDHIPHEISSKKLKAKTQLMAFNIVERSDGNMALIFSWHHLLLDGYGAVLLLQQLFVGKEETIDLAGDPPTLPSGIEAILDARKAVQFINQSSKGPISGVSPQETLSKATQQLKVITFTEEETATVRQKAITTGARFSPMPYLLTCVTRTVNALLQKRNQQPQTFWVPVPRDDRKKGARGPIIGNWLSFLFYRLPQAAITSKKEGVKAIQEQMMEQIKNKVPQSYNTLMHLMKWLPSQIYYFFVKRNDDNPLSGFLFTMAAEHPSDFNTVLGHRIQGVLSWPSNTVPPGLTFAVMTHQQRLNIMVLYYKEVISEEEFTFIEHQLKTDLLT